MSERPVECSQCKKEAQVVYKEIVGKTMSCTEMCQDCPMLDQKLYENSSNNRNKCSGKTPNLCCASCMTTLDSIRSGNPIGCSNCYSVFGEILVNELLEEEALPLSSKEVFHTGKRPTQTISIQDQSQIATLNEALKEAVSKEQYEQAAWLRDQIKALAKQHEPS